MNIVGKLSLSLLSTALVLCLLEISARLLSKTQFVNPSYIEISKGYKNVDQLLHDWSVLQFQYHDYYIYSPAPASSRTVNFTDYFGARSTPASVALDKAEEIIWAFGGSTMQNLEADDALSLANQIAVGLNNHHIKARVLNFGAGGFQSSLETIKFQDLLRRVPNKERPTTVVFYDGFNEVQGGYFHGAGNLQSDISGKMSDLVERHYLRLGVYIVSEVLSRYSVFWRDFIGNRINNSLYSDHAYGDKGNVDKTVSSYVLNVRMTRGICNELSIRCLFILQPLIVTKSKPTIEERRVIESFDKDYIDFVRKFYARAALQLRNLDGFLDLTQVLDQGEESEFFDLGHTSPFTGATIGREIAYQIAKSRMMARR
jgi:hypothetical protein